MVTRKYFVITKNPFKRKYYISGMYSEKEASKFIKSSLKGKVYATKLTPSQRKRLPKIITQEKIAKIKRKY